MNFLDIVSLSWRNLREAPLRAALTTIGVVVGVAVIVTMVSFGLGLQRNTIQRFKDLDLFNEITVFGNGLLEAAGSGFGRRPPQPPGFAARPRAGSPAASPSPSPSPSPARVLDDAAVAEIEKIPGVVSVEPTISFNAYVRANGKAVMEAVSGALVPNPATRFREFAAGRMIASPQSDEAIVEDSFLKDFGYGKAEDAIGKTIDLLAPPDRERERASAPGDTPTFFGLPLEEESGDQPGMQQAGDRLVAKSFRIVGVLKSDNVPGGARRRRGLLPASDIYVSLPAAREWTAAHRGDLTQVALQLARESGMISSAQAAGYASATVRVADPVVLTDVRKRLGDLGFSTFSIVDQLEQLRTIFLIINSALGLLGGISLLVASFGIANTMIMSILERTREIGIMKAIGAEDREIKLIFFVEAALIGFAGGVTGTVVAWGIDGAANRLAYRFLLKPQGASYVDFFALPPYLWLGAIVFAVVVGVVAALYPAARAARIDPVKALRHD